MADASTTATPLVQTAWMSVTLVLMANDAALPASASSLNPMLALEGLWVTDAGRGGSARPASDAGAAACVEE